MSEALAAGGSVLGGVLGYKGNQAAAKQAKQIADFNAQVAENEAIILRRRRLTKKRICGVSQLD